MAYARSLDVAGRAAKIDFVVPYGFLSGSADVAGEPREREVSGLWDPRLRFSMSIFGAPALAPREFASYRQDWILGWSVQVGLPLGQYDDTRVVNLGNNRWSVKPELGVSKALGRWALELAAAMTFYTDNDDYQGGRTREQDPVYTIQGHLVHTFPSRIWLAVDGTYYEGGAATIDGVASGDSLSSSRLGFTALVPARRAELAQALRQQRRLRAHRHRLRRRRRGLAAALGSRGEVRRRRESDRAARVSRGVRPGIIRSTSEPRPR